MQLFKRYLELRCKDLLHAIAFSYLVYVTLIAAIWLALAATGPLTIGSELAESGLVQTVCLGKNCERLGGLRIRL